MRGAILTSRVTQPEQQWQALQTAGELSEANAEAQRLVLLRREPTIAEGYGGQGARARFFAYFLVAQQESMAACGAAPPRF